MCQDKTLIETMGYIKKEENLSTIEYNIVPNTLVLESVHPFPGYHGANLPERSFPRSLFLVTSKEYSYEQIARITKKIKKNFNYDFNASHGTIIFKTTTLSCIRIKYLKSFTFLPELQGLLQNEGIKFAKQKMINSTAIILINKPFEIEEIEDGIYRDIGEDSKFYVEVPSFLTWEEFKEITMSIKNNIDNSNFDAAQGVLFRGKGISDVVRLYICEGEYEKVQQIRKMYIDQINKQNK